MKLRYTPEGASPQEWEFDPDRLLMAEASEVQRRCQGATYEEAKMGALKGNADAKLAFVYVMLRRDTPALKFEALRDSTRFGDISLDYDVAEMVDLRAEFQRQLDSGEADEPAAIRAAIEIFDKEIAEQGGVPEEQPEDPKDLAPEPSSETSGGLRSLPISTSTLETSTA